MKKRIDYFIARQLVFFFGAFCLVGAIPRTLGIIQTKPEFINFIGIVDFVAISGFVGAVAYTCYAIIHNAKLNNNETI